MVTVALSQEDKRSVNLHLNKLEELKISLKLWEDSYNNLLEELSRKYGVDLVYETWIYDSESGELTRGEGESNGVDS